MPIQNNLNGVDEYAAQLTRTQRRSQEKAKLGQTEMEAIEETSISETRETNKKSTAEESAIGQPENNHHVRGRPRQPEESGENAKWRLRYEAETETWQCTQCEKNTQKPTQVEQRHM